MGSATTGCSSFGFGLDLAFVFRLVLGRAGFALVLASVFLLGLGRAGLALVAASVLGLTLGRAVFAFVSALGADGFALTLRAFVLALAEALAVGTSATVLGSAPFGFCCVLSSSASAGVAATGFRLGLAAGIGRGTACRFFGAAARMPGHKTSGSALASVAASSGESRDPVPFRREGIVAESRNAKNGA